jgi:phenylacetate-CoA ligase
LTLVLAVATLTPMTSGVTPMFAPDMEAMPRDRLEALQRDRVATTVERLRTLVTAMTDRLSGLAPPRTLADLAAYPLTRKADLRDHYPFGLLAVDRTELRRVHASSGTTGKPTIVAYTDRDLDAWADCMARALVSAGCRPGWMLHNAYGYGLFTGGLGLHDGAARAGLCVVPVSGGQTERQLMLLEDLQPEAICCTPSYALTLGEAFAQRPGRLALRVGILGAEPWSAAMRTAIEPLLGITAINLYGLSEVIGPGVACECIAQDGLHLMEDHFLPEILDPITDEPLPDGQVGVLVLTSLTKEAFPVLRYWTGDLCSITREPCGCGRTTARMSSIVGRADDMLVIRGVNVYPSQVEHALLSVAGIGPQFQLVVTRTGTLDDLHVNAEAAVDGVDDNDREGLAAAVHHRLREALGLSVTVAVLAPGSVPRSEGGKLKRVVDERQI